MKIKSIVIFHSFDWWPLNGSYTVVGDPIIPTPTLSSSDQFPELLFYLFRAHVNELGTDGSHLQLQFDSHFDIQIISRSVCLKRLTISISE